jgi:hypothetical protein
MKIFGKRRVQEKLRACSVRNQKNAKKALLKSGYALLEFSNRIVPIDPNTTDDKLKDSGFVHLEMGWLWSTVVVGYTAPHALYVHEDLEKAHGEEFNIKHAAEIAEGKEKPRRRQEQAKFLETASKKHAAELSAIIQKELKK